MAPNIIYISTIALRIRSLFCAPSCTTIGYLPISIDSQQSGYGTEPYIVYLFGGSATNTAISSNDIYKWNVSSNTYVKLSIKTPTTQFESFTNNAVQIRNIIYFVGIHNTQSVHLFDVTTEKWINNTNISPLPTHATAGCLTGNETHLFFIGGSTSTYYRLDVLQIYDIVANKWNSQQIDIAPIQNTGWNDGFCQFVDGTLYIFGGDIIERLFYEDPRNIVSDIFTLDTSMQWSNIGNLPMPLIYGTSLRYYHFIYIIGGGNDESGAMNVIYEFDTKMNQIRNEFIDIMIKPLYFVSAALINDNLYLFGGFSSSDDSNINDVQLCDILNNNVSSTTDLPTTALYTSSIDTVQPTAVPLSYTNVPTSNPNNARRTTTNTESITINTSKGAMTTNELSTLHPTNITTNHGSTQQQLVINATNNTINMIANTTNDKTLTTELKILSTVSYKQDYITSNILRPRMKTDDASKYIVLGIIGVFLGVLVGVIALCSYMYLERRKEQNQKKEDVSIIRFAADDDVKMNELEPQPMFIQQDIQLTEEGLGGFYEAKCVICNQMRIGKAGQIMAFYCIECKKKHDPNILQDNTKGYLSRNIPSQVIVDQVTASGADTRGDDV